MTDDVEARISHGGVIPFHTTRRRDCPWCQTMNVQTSVTLLRRALGQAFQLLVAHNTGKPNIYPAETWRAIQMEAARTNLMTAIHDPMCSINQTAALTEAREGERGDYPFTDRPSR